MSCVVELLRARASRADGWARAAALALTVSVAACSGDASRFSDNRGNPDATGAIPPAQGAPVGRVDSRPLPPQTAQAAPPQQAASASSGIAGGGRGMASYNPAAYAPASQNAAVATPSQVAAAPMRPSASVSPDVTGSVAPAPAPRPTPASNWTWDGGKPVTVAPGDTMDTIARRHGVPTSAIMQANNIAAPTAIYPGQQLVIPRYTQAAVASAPAPAPVQRQQVAPPVAAPKPVATVASPAGNPGVHVVAPGETLSKISRLYGKPVTEIAKANNIQTTGKLNVGDRLVIPGVRVSAAKPKLTPVVAQANAQAKPAVAVVAKEPEPVQTVSLASTASEAPAANDATKSADGTGSLPKFRWPANGRVIAAYGPTPNGQQNDGINIALPENTPVKAAEDGVIAYAGNELKGYGNLVLVRHPNGYVTAYAHAKELLVKRGDQVKRGQVIARSGQTGNVNAPQLHFEIRKGAAPLDPTKFLNGA
jgi:murein DD-endopeptidase MepM/ murein hydrolase activator NlpD